MTRRTWLILITCGLAVMGGLFGLTRYYINLPDHLAQQETIVLGQQRLIPGAQAVLRVVVRDSRDATPLSNATVSVLMHPPDNDRAIPLFNGRTDADGNIDVTFTVPENAAPEQILLIETRSELGADTLEHPVTVQPDYRIHLTTDKSRYQPGDMIHIRTLALSAFERRPAAEQRMRITVTDARGNIVFRQRRTASQYGVAAADFQLADAVNSGPYRVTAALDETVAQKTITILAADAQPTSPSAALSTFDITMTTERDFYRPGERVVGTLHADYPFGKPVANGAVRMIGAAEPLISESPAALQLAGQTDASGNFDFAFDLPAAETLMGLAPDHSQFYIEAHVSDTAPHTQTHRLSLSLAEQALIIEAMPESGQFHPGVENILYVLTSRPDGAPIPANLTVRIAADEMFTTKTDPYGLAEIRFTPQTPNLNLIIEAETPEGATARRAFDFTGAATEEAATEESVLLRPDAPLYRVGDTMRLTILASEPTGVVYLDIVREGQAATPAWNSRAVPIVNGQAEMNIDLPADLFGILHLHAYKILRSGDTVHDTRRVVVEARHDLNVALTPGAGAYRPGDTATLHLHVTDAEGAGLPTELGIAVIAETNFTAAEYHPEFAELTFLLGEDLLSPRYQLDGLGLPDMIGAAPADAPALRKAQAGVATASLAAGAPAPAPFTLRVDTHAEAMARARARQTESLASISQALTALLLLTPVIILAVNGVAMWRTASAPRQFWRRMGLAGGAVLVIHLALTSLPATPAVADGALALLTLCGGSGFIAALIFAVREQDRALVLTLGLILCCGFIAGDLPVISRHISDGAAITWITPMALALLSTSLLLRAVDFIFAHKLRRATALIAVTLFLLIGAPALINQSSAAWRPAAAPHSTAPSPTAATETAESKALPSPGQTASERDAPRLSSWPPATDTLLWLPNAVTNESGALQVDFPVADSITTWRVAALASAQDGRLGSATSELRVFQDFFIHVDLPPALTVGDQISVPVAIYNYLPEPQTLQLEVEQARWFELLSAPGREIEIAPNDMTIAYFPLRVLNFGRQPFQVTAWGSAMSDAIREEVYVIPNGDERSLTRAGLVMSAAALTTATSLSETLTLPETIIPGTQALTVKLTPGVSNHLVESLDTLQNRPTGSLEPTASAAYPGVLLLDYLQATGQSAPEAYTTAKAQVNSGYQRLITFETPGDPGGFSRFGQAPADPLLTAYSLQTFSAMQRVHPVDPALVNRSAAWLFEQQRADGSWANTADLSATERLPATAFVLWGLADAGYAAEARAQQAADFLREAATGSEEEIPGYTLALVANALVAMDTADEGRVTPATWGILQHLAGIAELPAEGNGDTAYWESERATYLGGTGASADVETTALAALALFRAERHVELANAAVRMLLQNKDSFGAWHTTSATALALKALRASVETNADSAESAAPVTVNVTLNENEIQSATLALASLDTQPPLAFEEALLGAENTVDIQIDEPGATHFVYQIVGRYYLPWDAIAVEATTPEAILLNVTYDRPELAIGETVEVAVTALLNPALTPAEATHWTADSAIIELGIPPGFEVRREDLGRIVSRFDPAPDNPAAARVERCELAEGRIILYVTNLTSRDPLTFTYRLRATFPVVAQTPASIAYDAYNPDVMGKSPPQTLTVLPAASD